MDISSKLAWKVHKEAVEQDQTYIFIISLCNILVYIIE